MRHLRGAHRERVLGTRGVGTYKKEGKPASFFLHSLVYDASLRRRARVDPRSCHSHATLFLWTTYLYVVVVVVDDILYRCTDLHCQLHLAVSSHLWLMLSVHPRGWIAFANNKEEGQQGILFFFFIFYRIFQSCSIEEKCVEKNIAYLLLLSFFV